MKNLYLYLVSAFLISTNVQAAQTEAYTLEVNVGPLFIEYYNSPSNGNLPGCSPSLTIRQCMQQVYARYKTQGVKGVRFLYYMSGDGKPFQGNGQINAQWLQDMKQAMADIKAAGIDNVIPTPSWNGWGNGKEITVYDSCLGKNATYRFYVASPMPFQLSNDFPYEGRNDKEYNDSYRCAPANPIFVGWQPIYNLLNELVGAAKTAGLNISQFDIVNELNILWFPVNGRFIYDPTSPNGNLYGKVREIMASHGYDSGRVTYSVIPDATSQTGFDCASAYGDSGRVGQLSALYAAIQGRPFGHPSGWSVQNRVICGGNMNDGAQIPVAQPVPKINDIHSYSCVMDASGNCDPSKDNDVVADTTVLFNSMQAFLDSHGQSTGNFTLGETFVGAKDTNGRLCEANGPPTAPAQIQKAFLDSRLYKTAGRTAAANVIRPWVNVASSCEGVNVPVNPPYNAMVDTDPVPTPTPTPGGLISASPNPILVAAGEVLGVTKISWNVPGVSSVEVHIGSASGPLFAAGGGIGEAMTGKWVQDGTVFYLVNKSNGQVLDTVTAHLVAGGVIQPPVVAPVITNAGTGCADNYCIWIVADNMGGAVAVDIYSSAEVLLATYQGGEINYTPADHVVTLGLRSGSEERTLFASQPLKLKVRNLDNSAVSGFRSVSH